MFFFFRNLTAAPSDLESTSMASSEVDYTSVDSIQSADFSREPYLSQISERVELLGSNFKNSSDYEIIFEAIDIDETLPLSSMIKLDTTGLVDELLYNYRLLKSLNNEAFNLQHFYVFLKSLRNLDNDEIQNNDDPLSEALDFKRSFRDKFNSLRERGNRFSGLFDSINSVYNNVILMSLFSVSNPEVVFKVKCSLLSYMNQLLNTRSIYWILNDPFELYNSKIIDLEDNLSEIQITDFSSVDYQSLRTYNTRNILFSNVFSNSVEAQNQEEILLDISDFMVFIDLLNSTELLNEINIKIWDSKEIFVQQFPFIFSKINNLAIFNIIDKAFKDIFSQDDISEILLVSRIILNSGNSDLINKFISTDYLYSIGRLNQNVISFLNDITNPLTVRFFIAYFLHTRVENQEDSIRRFRRSNFQLDVSILGETDQDFPLESVFVFPCVDLMMNDLVSIDVLKMNHLHHSKHRFDLLRNKPTSYLLRIMSGSSSNIYTSSFNGVFDFFIRKENAADIINTFFESKKDILSSFLLNCFNFGRFTEILELFKDQPSELGKISVFMTCKNLDSRVLALALNYEIATTLVSFNVITNELEYFNLVDRAIQTHNLSMTLEMMSILRSIKEYFSRTNSESSENENLVFGNQMNQVVCFYDDWTDDKDGHNSLKSFLRIYDIRIDYDTNGLVSRISGSGASNIDESFLDDGFLILNLSNPRTGNSIKTYISLPRIIKEGSDPVEYTSGLDNLKEFLTSNQVRINQLIHKGHSFHTSDTLNAFDVSNIQSVINCCCGGFSSTMSLLDDNPDISHVFSTRGIGTMFINDLIVRFGNQRYLESSDGSINYSDLYQFISRYVSSNSKFRERFSDYRSVDYLTDVSLRILRYHKERIWG